MLIKNIKLIHHRHKICKFSHNLRRYSQAASILTTPKKQEAVEEVFEESLYPPVKPKYPPGQWAKINPASAWKIHETTHDILQAPSAKWRLEKLAGSENKKLWAVSPLAPRPNNLQFQEVITRSHLLDGFPDVVKEEASKLENSKLVDRCCEIVQLLYHQEFHQLSRNSDENNDDEFYDDSEKEMRITDLRHKSFISRATKMLLGLLSGRKEHLKRAELDEAVQVQTFWSVGGFEGEEKSGEGAWEGVESVDGKDVGILTFQYKHLTDLQVRSEMPLPEFVSMDDPLCRYALGEVPMPLYAPDAVNFEVVEARPISVAGQWIGGSCEFIPYSMHHLPSHFTNRFRNFGDGHLEQAEKVYMITSMFASCLSQAYNQGFCDLLDLTYPITTQCLLTTPHHFRIASYQLNTTMLWNDANPLRNLAWISPKIPIFVSAPSLGSSPRDAATVAEEGDGVRKINSQFVKALLQSLMLQPCSRGVNLRPYLPHDPSPLSLPPPINHLGDPPPQHYVPGRFEYPKVAVYF